VQSGGDEADTDLHYGILMHPFVVIKVENGKVRLVIPDTHVDADGL
jgi:hypothetical protein